MKTRKFLALLLTIAMVFTMSSTVFAADANAHIPSASDTATVTVQGVENGATVTLYQIVKGKYNTTGLLGYEAVKAGSIAKIESPTLAEVTALAADTSGLTSTSTTRDTATGDYKATVHAGTYMVLVTGTNATVYNPMIVSVNYNGESTVEGGTVNADQDKWVLEDQTAVAKKSTPEVDKKIVSSDAKDKDNNAVNNANDVAVGDTVNFEIDTTIPSYSAQYKDLKFDVTDTLSAGFDPAEDILVKVNGTTVTAGNDTFTKTTDGNTFTISFKDAFIRANGGKSVAVTYHAVVNSNAALNYDANENTAQIKFSNNPNNTSSYGTDEDKTYSYTFAIDGNLKTKNVTEPYKTHELIKVNENGEVEVVSSSTEKLDTITVTGALKDAEFTLTNNATKKVYTATSDANGYLNGFTGLDAGTYTLKETVAPQGYVVDTTEHTVVISAVYNADGTLATYSITIDGTNTSTYEATYDSNGNITEFVGKEQQTLVINNTKIPGLPSTGGMGTTIFYILGAALIICAGVVLVARRRMGSNA